MDFEDWLFVASITLIGGGTACYSPPAGAIVVGLLLAIPPLASLARGAIKKRDGEK